MCSSASGAPVRLKVTTFNLLNPTFNRIDDSGARESTRDELWVSRNAAIVRHLSQSDSDIVALQEYWVEGPAGYRALYEHQLCSLGPYEAIECPRPGRSDGCLTLLGPRVELLEEIAAVHLGDFADRVAHIIRVRVGGERGAEVLLVNTHLTFPHAPHLTSLRLDELRRIMCVLHETQSRLSPAPEYDLPIICCGDFNGSPSGLVYHAMHAHGFVSAVDRHRGCGQYARRVPRGPDGRVEPGGSWITHRAHTGRCSGVDYVWFRDALTELEAPRRTRLGEHTAQLAAQVSERLLEDLSAADRRGNGSLSVETFARVTSQRLFAPGGGAATADVEDLAKHPLRDVHAKYLASRADELLGLEASMLDADGPDHGGQDANRRGLPRGDVRYKTYVRAFERRARAIAPAAWRRVAPTAQAWASARPATWAIRAVGSDLFPEDLKRGVWPGTSYALSDHGVLSVSLELVPVEPAARAGKVRPPGEGAAPDGNTEEDSMTSSPASLQVPLCLALRRTAPGPEKGSILAQELREEGMRRGAFSLRARQRRAARHGACARGRAQARGSKRSVAFARSRRRLADRRWRRTAASEPKPMASSEELPPPSADLRDDVLPNPRARSQNSPNAAGRRAIPEAAMMDALWSQGRRVGAPADRGRRVAPLPPNAEDLDSSKADAEVEAPALSAEFRALLALPEAELRVLESLPELIADMTPREQELYQQSLAALDYFGDWADPANTQDSLVLSCLAPEVIDGEYTCRDGRFTPTRAALHARILDHMVPPAANASASDEPCAYIVVGVPGSGKDAVIKRHLRRVNPERRLIDASADRLKGFLARWADDDLCRAVREHCRIHGARDRGALTTSQSAAHVRAVSLPLGNSKQLLHAQYLHRESIHVVRKVVRSAVARRHSFMYAPAARRWSTPPLPE